MSARKAIQYSVNLALVIAVVLVVAVCYFEFTLLHPSKLDCVTYKRLPAIQDVSIGIVVPFCCSNHISW